MLRYVERVGLVEPARSAAGYRLYGPAELQRLRTLRELLDEYDIDYAILEVLSGQDCYDHPDFALEWNLSGEPFLTPPGGLLRETVIGVCRDLCGLDPEQSTGGGTSDGRFIAPMGAQVIELGVINESIHKVNECVRVADIDRLHAIYRRTLELLLVS